MKHIQITVALVILGIIGPTIGVAQASAVILHSRTITKIVAYDDYVIIQFTPTANPSQGENTGCGKNNQLYLDLQGDNGQPMYAAALTAASSGKLVSLRGWAGQCFSHWDAATLYRIDVNF